MLPMTVRTGRVTLWNVASWQTISSIGSGQNSAMRFGICTPRTAPLARWPPKWVYRRERSDTEQRAVWRRFEIVSNHNAV